MAEPDRDLETVEKTEMRYGAEPAFPWPLLLAWITFATWGIYYIATRLVPAYAEWTVR
ncbi:MAG: hypothetical protein ACAI25_04255 [Planctomycetota bacterium]